MKTAIRAFPIIGAIVCMVGGLFSLAMMAYWAHVTGSWISDKVLYWNPFPLVCVGGIFFFTRIIDPICEAVARTMNERQSK